MRMPVCSQTIEKVSAFPSSLHITLDCGPSDMAPDYILPDQGPISLDTTLADLYTADNGEHEYIFVPLFLSSRIKLGSAVSKPEKFLYFDDIVNQDPKRESDIVRLQREYGIKYFAMIVQRFAFAAGRMPVLVVDPEVLDKRSNSDSTEEGTERFEAQKTLNVLGSNQRPFLISSVDLKDWAPQGSTQQLAVTFPIDDIKHHPHVVDPETHYELLSKRGLALSGLKTPACQIIDFGSPPSWKDDCCEACRSSESSDEVPATCTGSRKPWVDDNIEHVVSKILARPVPYVLKLQQTVSGAGTFILTTPEERDEAAQHVKNSVLKFLLAKIKPCNAHLHPASVILSDMVEDISETISVTFFVTKKGREVYLCCSRQQMSGGNQWIGSTIDYREQETLQKRTAATTNEVARFLHRAGYAGPVGMDILQDKHGVQWVVDLNVRTPSSLLLGPLRSHFTSRSLPLACLITRELALARTDFQKRFESSFREGRIIIVAWFEEHSRRSTGSLVIGGEEQGRIDELIELIDEQKIVG